MGRTPSTTMELSTSTLPTSPEVGNVKLASTMAFSATTSPSLMSLLNQDPFTNKRRLVDMSLYEDPDDKTWFMLSFVVSPSCTTYEKFNQCPLVPNPRNVAFTRLPLSKFNANAILSSSKATLVPPKITFLDM